MPGLPFIPVKVGKVPVGPVANPPERGDIISVCVLATGGVPVPLLLPTGPSPARAVPAGTVPRKPVLLI